MPKPLAGRGTPPAPDELPAAAEARLRLIKAATGRASRPLRGAVAITRRVDKALDKHKMRKHSTAAVRDDCLNQCRNREKHRRRSRARRLLCRAAQPAGNSDRHRQNSPLIQAFRKSRTGVPRCENRQSEGSSGLSPLSGPGARACSAVYAMSNNICGKT